MALLHSETEILVYATSFFFKRSLFFGNAYIADVECDSERILYDASYVVIGIVKPLLLGH